MIKNTHLSMMKIFYNSKEVVNDADEEILTFDIEEVKLVKHSAQISKENIHKSSDERYQIGDNTEMQAHKREI